MNILANFLVKELIELIKRKTDKNWDQIIHSVSELAKEKGLNPDDNSDSALRTIADCFAEHVRESNIFGQKEDDLYFWVMKVGNVNWDERIKNNVRALSN
ncbi:hypothetical protein [Bacterioplanoides sp.]|uniref:hypothetical protein n=1 Tax=Bacterioplanoides sp. TaxID=2066072 RepID=UPI003B5A14A0